MKIKLLPLAILCGSSALFAGCSDSDKKPAKQVEVPKEQGVTEGTKIAVRLLETTDLHANLLNFNYFADKQDDKVGLVKTAALIRQARDEAANSLLVDNGDLIQGSPLGDYMAKVKKLS